jgi:hypothetical protein
MMNEKQALFLFIIPHSSFSIAFILSILSILLNFSFTAWPFD